MTQDTEVSRPEESEVAASPSEGQDTTCATEEQSVLGETSDTNGTESAGEQ